MKTHEFIKELRNSADKEVIFANADGQSIHEGYHLTEITILQLWVPEDAEDTHMKSDKFLRICDKVQRLVPVDEEAEVRIEYGDENFFPAPYHISNCRQDKAAIRFFLEPPATTCKARDRALSGKAENCCA